MSTSMPKGPLRGLGSYSTQPQPRIQPRIQPQIQPRIQPPRVERRPAMVVRYQGQRAHIRFHDGTTYAMPSAPLMQIGIPEGGLFTIVTGWVGKTPVESRVEPPHDPRPASDRRNVTPKIVDRNGKKMITRQPGR